MTDKLKNLRQAAKLLNRNKDEVRKLAKGGRLPGFKLFGERWVFDSDELEEWKDQNPKKSYKVNARGIVQDYNNGMSVAAIANKYKVSKVTVNYHLNNAGITRSRGRPQK